MIYGEAPRAWRVMMLSTQSFISRFCMTLLGHYAEQQDRSRCICRFGVHLAMHSAKVLPKLSATELIWLPVLFIVCAYMGVVHMIAPGASVERNQLTPSLISNSSERSSTSGLRQSIDVVMFWDRGSNNSRWSSRGTAGRRSMISN